MRIADEVRARARARFVGRGAELARMQAALDGPGSSVVWVFGPGGIGKSTLLAAFADLAEAAGRTIARCDLRGAEAPRVALRATFEASGSHDARRVLLIDTFERVAGLEGWVRDELVGELPVGTIIVIGGRQPPSPEWRADPAWSSVLHVVPLRELSVADARELLARDGVADAERADAVRLAKGHPLALSLIAQLIASRPDGRVPAELVDAPDLVAGLLAKVVDDTPSGDHRHALDVCSLTRITTRSLLRAIFGDARAHELYDWLERQPYVDRVDDGICLHDLVRDVLEVDLRRSDPDRYAEAHRQIRAYTLDPDRLRRQPDRAIKDFMYLHRASSLLTAGWDWPSFGTLDETPIRGDEVDAACELVRASWGDTNARCLAYWAARQPQSIIIARSGGGQLEGVVASIVLAEPNAADLEADPAVAAIWKHALQRGALRPGQVIGVLRVFADRVGGFAGATPTFNVMSCRHTRHWLTTAGLALDYIIIPEAGAEPWMPMMSYIDFHPIDVPVMVSDLPHRLFVHDWREVTTTHWLARMEALELGGEIPARPLVAPVLIALDEHEFAGAVRAALRDLATPARLADNPLVGSRVVRDHEGTGAAGLERVLRTGYAALPDDPRTERARSALDRTYLRGAATQEAAAEALGMAFSTYRRHLGAGIDLLVDQLWRWELYGRE